MIHEIPAAMRETLRRSGEAAAAARGLSAGTRLFFTGCGTAYFSALLAQRVSTTGAGGDQRSMALPAVELSAYTTGVGKDSGVIGVSHSGITKATVDALQVARTLGARTVGITHFADRPIAAVSGVTLVVGNGPDRSRCHTKCYVAGAAAAAMVGWEWNRASGRFGGRPLEASLSELPDLQAEVLRAAEKPCEELAAAHLDRRATFLVGFGPNEPNALEGALKLMETSFTAAQGLETEQFLHGPAQVLDGDAIVFALVPKGRGRGRTLDLLRAAKTVGAQAVAIATEGDHEVEEASETALFVPEVEESLSPFLTIIPLYLYAYHASVKRGHNPDVLRYHEPGYWAARNIVFPPGTH